MRIIYSSIFVCVEFKRRVVLCFFDFHFVVLRVAVAPLLTDNLHTPRHKPPPYFQGKPHHRAGGNGGGDEKYNDGKGRDVYHFAFTPCNYYGIWLAFHCWVSKLSWLALVL